MKKTKKDEVLFVRIKGVNRRWLDRESKRTRINRSDLIDMYIEIERKNSDAIRGEFQKKSSKKTKKTS